MMIKISLSIIGLLFIPLVMMQRDYPAIGGEIFLPVLPFLIWEWWKSVTELIKEWKGCEENRSERDFKRF